MICIFSYCHTDSKYKEMVEFTNNLYNNVNWSASDTKNKHLNKTAPKTMLLIQFFAEKLVRCFLLVFLHVPLTHSSYQHV